jgi:hypothetical protein
MTGHADVRAAPASEAGAEGRVLAGPVGCVWRMDGHLRNRPLYKPGITGRLALHSARTYFTLTSKIPALRRKFLDDLRTHRTPDAT